MECRTVNGREGAAFHRNAAERHAGARRAGARGLRSSAPLRAVRRAVRRARPNASAVLLQCSILTIC